MRECGNHGKDKFRPQRIAEGGAGTSRTRDGSSSGQPDPSVAKGWPLIQGIIYFQSLSWLVRPDQTKYEDGITIK